MKVPNLQDPAERATYRKELIQLHRGWRLCGLAIVCAGVVWELTAGHGWDFTAIATEIAGWSILLAVILMRTRHHRRRMRGG